MLKTFFSILVAWAFGMLLMVWLGSCLPQPLNQECVRYKDCSSCVLHYCGWYSKKDGDDCDGCFSLKEPRSCSGFATSYEPYCRADVTDPSIYGRRKPPAIIDGGAP